MGTTVVGLDIGSSLIRGVQVTRDNKGMVQIDKIAEEPIKHGSVYAGSVQEHDHVVAALKALWKKAKFSTNIVRLGVGSDAMIARVGELEWAPDADLAKILPYSTLVQEKLMEEPEQFYLDYHTLSEYTAMDTDPNDPDEKILVRRKFVLVGGGRRDAVDSLIKAARDAKLKPISVDINGLSLIRAYDHELFGNEHDAVDASIDIGADSLTVVLHKAGQPLYMRAVREVSGNAITEAVRQELKVNFEKAELRKFEALYTTLDEEKTSTRSAFDFNDEESDDNSPEATEDEKVAKAKERAARLRPILAQGNSGILNTVRATIDHFMSGAWGAELPRPSGFLLSGGVAYTPGLAERLESEFGVPVAIATPITTYSDDSQRAKFPDELISTEAAYTIAFGLAVGEGSSHA